MAAGLPTDGPGSEEEDADGAAFDAYLAEALAGRVPDPADFLARHPGVSPDLRDRVEAFHRSARRRPAAAPGSRREPEPGLPRERVGEFRLLRRIGAGGMGIVYEAEQESLRRSAAVKILRPDLDLSPEARRRFRQEASVLARLRHPHIVPVLAAGEEEGVRWIAMEYVAGRSLDVLLREEPGGVNPARAVRWAALVARALECAHGIGVIHRDVKPGNLLVDLADRPHLLDFGVAREGSGGATLTGPFVGSAPWAAPEQLAGSPVDARADVFGLGATLYHALTGVSPFAAGTVDRTIHRVLHEDPAPPGRLRGGIPRDLDAVVLRALEKDPDDRYPTAGALAEDLEALLDLRPVRARPPGPIRRLRAFARRRPGVAATAATAALAVVLVVAAAAAGRAGERERVRREAAGEVSRARGRLEDFRRGGREVRAKEEEVAGLRELLESAWLGPEKVAALEKGEAALEELRREREAAFHEALEDLRRAERLDPAVEGCAEVRARLYAERWRDAEAAKEPLAAASFLELARSQDPEGRVVGGELEPGRVTLAATAPEAEVHLFRFREEAEVRPGGERRLVPVPLREGAPVTPGAEVRRVLRGAGSLVPGDLVLDAAATPARVLAGGRVREEVLPEGLLTRTTLVPLPLGEWSLAGTAPVKDLPLPPGGWVAVFRAPGMGEERVAFTVAPGASLSRTAALLPEGSLPEGFVRAPLAGGGAAVLMDREVTCAEYRAFLNDPATLAALDGDGDPRRLVPRNRSEAAGGHWTRGADGRFELPDDWREDWPVLGVSWEDAAAYAAWRTARDRPLGGRGAYALPTFEEWRAVSGNEADARYFVTGNLLRPWWVKSCFSRETAGPEPVLSYPRDESIYGARDMAGSVAEWCEDWLDEARSRRRLAGGSWAWARMEAFKIWAAQGYAPGTAADEAGFRLALREVRR